MEISYLAGLSVPELANWLHMLLKYDIADPLDATIRDEPAGDWFLDAIWDAIDDESSAIPKPERKPFRDRIKASVAELVRDWTLPHDPPVYFVQVLHLAGELTCVDTLDNLLDLASGAQLEGIGSGVSFDLQRELLAVAFNMPVASRPEKADEQRKRISALIDVYIDNPQYCDLAFDKSWRLDRERALALLRRYMKASLEHPIQDVEDVIVSFHTGTGSGYFETAFIGIRRALLAESRYAKLREPRLLYRRYALALRQLCTLTWHCPEACFVEDELTSLVEEAGGGSRADEPRVEVEWHPPYRPELITSFPIEFDPEPVDMHLFGLGRSPQRDLTSRLRAAIGAEE